MEAVTQLEEVEKFGLDKLRPSDHILSNEVVIKAAHHVGEIMKSRE